MSQTNTDQALAALEAAQDAFSPIADEMHWAREALKRSKSKVNIARYIAASAAFDAGLELCDSLHEAVALAEKQDSAVQARTDQEAAEAAEPKFL